MTAISASPRSSIFPERPQVQALRHQFASRLYRAPRSGTYEPAPATSRGQGLMRVLINTKNRGANAVARPAKGSNAPGYLLATGDSTSPPDQLDVFGVTTSASAFPTIIAWRPCRCGCATATLGSSHSVHAGRLTCSACRSFMGWASHVLVAEIRRGFVTGLSTFEPGFRP